MQLPHFFAAKQTAAVVAAASGGFNSPPYSFSHSQLIKKQQQTSSDLATLQTKSLNIQNNQQEPIEAVNNKQTSDTIQPASKVMNKDTNTNSWTQNVEHVNCHLCSKSFCNLEYLRLHLINKHGVNPIKTRMIPATESSSSTSTSCRYELKLKDSDTFCFLCEKEFQTKIAIKAHILQKHADDVYQQEAHKPNEPPKNESDSVPNGKCLDKVICLICKKQLCNKYFLRTHKLKVHGIQDDPVQFDVTKRTCESQNGNRSNSRSDENEKENNDEQFLVHDAEADKDPKSLKAFCEICNKELCNKYFLKSHMANAHNFSMDDGSVMSGAGSETDENIENTSKKLKKQSLKTPVIKDNKQLVTMQAFQVESKDKKFNDYFVSCLIYLPTKKKIEQSLSLQLQLKPFQEKNQDQKELFCSSSLDSSEISVKVENGFYSPGHEIQNDALDVKKDSLPI
jgi:hypothetical protein